MAAFGNMLRSTVNAWIDDNVPMHGAALAFYSILSIAPLFVIALAIAGALFGEQAAGGELNAQLRSIVSEDGAKTVQDLLAHTQQPGAGVWASLISLVLLFIGGSCVFAQLQWSLNAIWKVRLKPGGGLRNFFVSRLLPFAMIIASGGLLVLSLVLSTILSGIGRYFGAESLLRAAELGISFLVVTLLFAMIYKVLPDVVIAWKDVWAGAALTAVLFTAGKFAIGEYLAYAGIQSSYGAAGSLVVLLLWVYYSSQILFFGAEFTQVYAQTMGSPILPAKHAERITS
jgi:membrane protein